MAAGEELGVGYVTLTVSTRGLGKDIAKEFRESEKQAAQSGKRMGKAVSDEFAGAVDLDSFAREIEIAEAKGTRAVEKAAEAQKKAREKAQDAAAKQVLEERRLVAARQKAENSVKAVADAEQRYQRAVESSGESSREAQDAAEKLSRVREREANAAVGVASAEDKVTRARRGAVSAADDMARATRNVAEAQDELQKELKRTRDAYAEAEAAAKRAGDDAADNYVDGWRGMAGRLGRVVRNSVDKALSSVGVTGKGLLQGKLYGESFKKGMDSVKQSSPVEALGFLSGGRVMADMGTHFTHMVTGLDRAVPMMALMATGVASLAGAALSASSGLLGVAAGLGSIAAAGLLLPGMYAAAGAGVAVLAMALADANKVLADLGPKFKDLQKTVSANFWAEAAQPIRDFVNDVLPILFDGLGRAATEMGRWATAITGVLGSAQGLSFISEAIGYMVHAVDIAGDGIAAMTGALLQLATVGMSYLPDLASWFNNIAYSFEDWVAKSVASGDMFKWIDSGLANLKALGGVLFHTVGIFHALGQAAFDAGAGGLIGLASGMRALDDAMHGPVFQGALVTLFQGADVAMQGLAVGVRGLGDAFVSLAPTLANVMGMAGQSIGILVDGLARAVSHPVFEKGLNDFFAGVLAGVQALAPVFPIIGEKFGHLATLAGALAQNLGSVLAVAIEHLAPILNGLFEVITPIVPKLGEILSALIEGAAPVMGVVVAVLGALISVIVNVVSWLSNFHGVLQIVGGVLMVVAIAVGAVMAAMSIASTVMTVVTAITKGWAAAQWLLNAAMNANPIGLIVIAIAALVVALVAAYNNIGWFKDGVNAVWTAIQTAAGAVVTWFQTVLVPWFQVALAAVGAVFTWLWVNVVQPVWAGIQFAVSAFVTWFQTSALPFIQAVIQGIGAVMTWLWVNIIQPVWNGIMVFLTVIIAAIVTIFQGIVWVIRNVLGPVFSWLYNAIILPVWNAIKGAIGAAWAFIRDAIFTPLMAFIRGPLTFAWLWIRDTVSQVWGAIRGAVASSWAWIRDVVLFPLITFLRTTLTNAWLWLRNIVSQVWDAIRGKIAAIWNWVRDNVLNPAIGFLRNTFGPAWNWLRDVIGAAWGRIREMSSAAWNWVRDSVFAPFRGGLDLLKDAFNRTKDGIKTAWDKLKDAVKEPISFVVNSVVNPFLTNYNKINDFWSGKDIDTIKGFARGGVLPGYRASKSDDVMTPMRSGEGVLVPEVVRGLGSGFVHAANRVGNSGGVSAVKRWASEGFAKGGVISPVRGNPGLSQGYNRIHKGIDIAVPEGTPVYATADGVVSHAGPGARAPGVWGGNEVHVRGGGLERWFAHLSQIAVRAGERVKQGQLLGKSGNTGISSGPHLHFGVFQGGWPNDLDPTQYLKGAIQFGPDTGGGGFIDPVGWFMDKLSGAGFDWAGKVKAAKDKFAGNQFAQMGTGIAGKLFDGIKQKAADLASPLLNAADKAIEGGRKVVSGVADNTKLTAWMTEALTKKGMLNPLNLASGIRRAKQESGGDPNVVNNWDSNAKAGTPSKGLMQVIEPTFRQYMEPGHGNILDPVDNILASINYTYATYGSLRRGWDRAGGYALGGIVGESARSIGRSVSGVWDAPVGTVHALRPGVSTIYNGTGSTEMFQRVDTTAPGTGQEAHLHLHGTEYDESRMIRRGAEEWSRAFRKAGVAA